MTDFAFLFPEIFLALTLAGVLAGEITYHGERVRLVSATALVGLAAAFVQTLVVALRYGTAKVLGETLAVDGLSIFFKLFFIALAAFTIAISRDAKEIQESRRAEFCVLVVASSLAMCLAVSATDTLLMFLSLQAMNVLGYFLVGYSKSSTASTEASVKNMLFGTVSGGLFLFGLALLFGATHTLNLYEMRAALTAQPLSHQAGLIIFGLIFLSFSFQVACFPMYLWAPDVLEGAPTPAASFIALGSRATGFAVALRFFIAIFSQPAGAPGQWHALESVNWTEILGLAAGLSMTIGALLALKQTSAKRLVASLLIAETGFLLLGLLVLDQTGLAALLYSLVVELFALTGVFCVLSFFYDELKSDRLADLSAIMKNAVPETVALLLFLACLVGLPPLPGFIGKFALIGSAVRHDWYFLGTLAILSMTISAAAVARLAFSLVGSYRNPARTVGVAVGLQRRALLGGLLFGMLLLTVFANQVFAWAGQSIHFILW